MAGGSMELSQLGAAGALDSRMKEEVEMHAGQDTLRGARQSAPADEVVHPSSGVGPGRDKAMTGGALNSDTAFAGSDVVSAGDDARRRKDLVDGLDVANGLEEPGCPADGCKAAGAMSNGCALNGNNNQTAVRRRASAWDQWTRRARTDPFKLHGSELN
ncbi:hypothetical protein Vretifemale_20120 [Volvox reticuliferus]|uniref:Uncharacterized protein n=1 Tax=Volvox reticuliferus TaxID=1737510 RepID=A0A8J4D4T4_9CHLO|nr:hypothetical protein Vretifemale_20120 [Volvox reticuliferus]